MPRIFLGQGFSMNIYSLVKKFYPGKTDYKINVGDLISIIESLKTNMPFLKYFVQQNYLSSNFHQIQFVDADDSEHQIVSIEQSSFDDFNIHMDWKYTTYTDDVGNKLPWPEQAHGFWRTEPIVKMTSKTYLNFLVEQEFIVDYIGSRELSKILILKSGKKYLIQIINKDLYFLDYYDIIVKDLGSAAYELFLND